MNVNKVQISDIILPERLMNIIQLHAFFPFIYTLDSMDLGKL